MSAARARATTAASAGSYLSALMSLTMAAPRRARPAPRPPCRCRSRSGRELPGQALEDRLDRRQLLVGVHRLGAGPRGLAADVDQVGAGGLHLQRRVERRARRR